MVATPADEQDRPEPPFDATRVQDMFRQLDKTVRAHQLYLRNNPVYLKALDLLRALFISIWAETESLTIQVTETQLKWYGVSVHEQPEKASDSLPWTLFKDGLRELTLSSGFEEEELDALLDIIPRVRKAQDHEDDLLTLLWEQEFSKLSYRYVDSLSDPGLPIDTAAEPGRWPLEPGHVLLDPKDAIADAQAETGADGAVEEPSQTSSGIVKIDDFDSTLYFLDAKEIDYLRGETEREYAVDLRQKVVNALLDLLEQQSDLKVREEVAEYLDVLTLHLLTARRFANLAHLLRELAIVLQRTRDLQPEVRGRLALLPDRLSEPQALSQLLEAMEEATPLPPQEELAELFGQLRPSALGTVFSWLRQSRNAKLRSLLEAAADRLAQSHTTELVRLISSSDPGVVMEAVKRAGSLKAAVAVPALARVLGAADPEFRIAAVTALVDVGTPSAMQALEKALDDVERDVRVNAVKALAQRAYKPALARVSQLVKAKHIRDIDRTERISLFELFGAICGDAGVPYLDELLNGKGGLFGRREAPEVRACAAIALGRAGTEIAQDALQRAMGEKDVIVRSAVTRALKAGAA